MYSGACGQRCAEIGSITVCLPGCSDDSLCPADAGAALSCCLGECTDTARDPANCGACAARCSVANATERLETLFQEGRLRQLQGVGAALESKIVEYLSTGRMDAHEQVRRDFPIALASLLEIPGLGPGRARAVYRKFGICRICFRDMASSGLIPGVKKASW